MILAFLNYFPVKIGLSTFMPDYSVIMAGANYWKDNSPVLHEPNLEKLLKVSHFKEPYVSTSQDDEMTPDVPAFPYV